jgi:diguanylate cyclase (GGDEF)-like protein
MELRQREHNSLEYFQELLKNLHQVSIMLARINTSDALFRAAIELGRNQLGFDRLGVWLCDSYDLTIMHGTFGIDEHGAIRDERQYTIKRSLFHRSDEQPLGLLVFVEACDLLNHQSEVVGTGWQATVGIWDNNTFLGSICADNLIQQEPVSDQQLEVLALYGHVLGSHYTHLLEAAAREALLFREKKRIAELEALRETLTEISRELDLNRLLQSIVERLLGLCGGNNGSIGLYDTERRDIEIVAVKNLHETVRPGFRLHLGEGALGSAAATRQLLNLASYDQFENRSDRFLNWRVGPVLAVPLLLSDRLLGAMAVSRIRGSEPFDEADQRLLLDFAHQATIGIRNAQLYAEARHIAMVDMLTGLYNRRYCLDRIVSELARTQRSGTPTSIGMLDLDRFKRINDTHGHAIGDLVLREVARRLQHAIRAGDLVGRYGGEEFILLLPETDLAAAHEVAERLQRTLASIPIASDVGLLHITASIGLTMYAGELGVGVEELIARADTNLYRAKERGRDRVEG